MGLKHRRMSSVRFISSLYPSLFLGVAEWALRLLGEPIDEEAIKILLQTFGRPLDDFSELIEMASTGSVTASDIKHHFLFPLLRHYCDLMNSIGITQALDD